MTPKILAIDNDIELTKLLTTYLESENFSVESVHDGETGLKKALNQSFDAIILDIMLPHKNGFLVLKTLREHQTTPVLLLTARTDDIDRIIGLELGADDYLLKPCNPRELLARLRAILRRTPKTPPVRSIMEQSNITLDAAKRHVQKAGENIELTNTEFNILEMLMRSKGQAFSKEELTEYVLGRKFNAYDRSIDVHISHLRNKLGTNSKNEPILKTVRGFGYIFNE
jgi:two-component system, OmpR family, response regulator CpxR